MQRIYLLEFNANMNLQSCRIQSNTPKEAVEACMKKYKYPCNVVAVNNVKSASVKVTLINCKRKVTNYYSICYTGFDKNMSLGLRSSIGKTLSDSDINAIKKEALSIDIDISKLVFNDKVHLRTCYMAEEDKVYVGSDIFPDLKSMSTNPIDLLSIRAVLAHEYYGHRPRRQQYLNEEAGLTVKMPYWEDEYRANYDAAKNTPNLNQMDRYRLIQSAIRRCEEAGVFLERDEFVMEVLYGTSYN